VLQVINDDFEEPTTSPAYAQDPSQLSGDNKQCQSNLISDEHGLRDEVDHEAQLDDPGDDQQKASEEGQHCHDRDVFVGIGENKAGEPYGN
jgi:hypothetical protein